MKMEDILVLVLSELKNIPESQVRKGMAFLILKDEIKNICWNEDVKSSEEMDKKVNLKSEVSYYLDKIGGHIGKM